MYSSTPNTSRRYQSSNRSRSVGLDRNRMGSTPNRGQNDFYELRSRESMKATNSNIRATPSKYFVPQSVPQSTPTASFLVNSPPTNRHLDYVSPSIRSPIAQHIGIPSPSNNYSNYNSSPYGGGVGSVGSPSFLSSPGNQQQRSPYVGVEGGDNISDKYMKMVNHSQELNKQLHELKLTIIQKDDEIFNLKRQLTQKQSDVTDMIRKISPTKSSPTTNYQGDLINLIAQTQKKYEEQRAQNLELSNRLSIMNSDNVKYQQMISDLQAELDNQKNNENLYQQKYTLMEQNYQQQIEMLKKEKNNLSQQMNGNYQESLSQYESEIMNLKQQLEQVTLEKEHLELQLVASSNQSENINKENDNELEIMHTQLSELHLKLANSEKEKFDLKEQIHNLIMEKNNDDNRINQLQKELKEKENNDVPIRPPMAKGLRSKSPKNVNDKIEYYRQKLMVLYCENTDLHYKINQLKKGYNSSSSSENGKENEDELNEEEKNIRTELENQISELQDELENAYNEIEQLKSQNRSGTIDSQQNETQTVNVESQPTSTQTATVESSQDGTQTPKVELQQNETQTNLQTGSDINSDEENDNNNNQELINEIQKYVKEVERLTEENRQLKDELDSIKSDERRDENDENLLEEKIETIKDLSQNIIVMNEDFYDTEKQLKDEINEKNEIIKQLEEELNNVNTASAAKSEEELTNIQENFMVASKRVEDLEEECASLREQLDMANKNDVNGESSSEINALKEELEVKVNEIEQLKEEIEELKNELNHREEKIEELNAEIEILKSDNDNIKTKLDESLESNPEKDDKNGDNNEDKSEELSNKIKEQESIIRAQDEELNELREQNQKADTLIEQNKSLEKRIVELTISLNSVKESPKNKPNIYYNDNGVEVLSSDHDSDLNNDIDENGENKNRDDNEKETTNSKEEETEQQQQEANKNDGEEEEGEEEDNHKTNEKQSSSSIEEDITKEMDEMEKRYQGNYEEENDVLDDSQVLNSSDEEEIGEEDHQRSSQKEQDETVIHHDESEVGEKNGNNDNEREEKNEDDIIPPPPPPQQQDDDEEDIPPPREIINESKNDDENCNEEKDNTHDDDDDDDDEMKNSNDDILDEDMNEDILYTKDQYHNYNYYDDNDNDGDEGEGEENDEDLQQPYYADFNNIQQNGNVMDNDREDRGDIDIDDDGNDNDDME